ncbi:hypothetical protein SAMN05421878_10484 [Actinobaculum suis]|uniref:Probable membrane transporter protein n=1 Tax=Actinobaculum suis TaxID=1657 RepID=A0A0K9EUR4_9ACTO|nr:sulfite exporter TauE/SafE family protein [Actinobaculum suis]KMY23883.1 hypothetical protein ACU19_01830 [Actinobaculum suis]MDY5153606.1 sulfite exporter TauE/SafE family protein [Actinobaculum suis]OCA93107.1 hypothetical protein ACU21_01260 [Actinobaculum suis]OCA93251.1 hypothetical protein ACU20_02530 [Actinobaculum suis]SDE23904.1 hypothetical protein SAMN05421878_10484 [Actinobaculum suis]
MLLVSVFGIGLIGAIIGYLSGAASVFTYPALLMLGFPPVIANTTNVISNIGGSTGTTIAAFRQIRQVRSYPRWPQYLIGAAGGALGGYLLLVADPGVFEAVVPWLVLFSVLSVVIAPILHRLGRRVNIGTGAFMVLVFIVGIYSGYFGAASAILYMAMARLLTNMTTREALVMKAPVTLGANLVAGIYYAAMGAVDYPAALSMMAGGIVGGWIGPKLGRFFSDRVINILILIFGLALFFWLLLR